MILQTPICITGYGLTGWHIAKELIKIKNITILPVGNPDEGLYRNLMQHDIRVKKANKKDPVLKIWHQHELFERAGSGKYFGFPIFELDRFKSQEISSLEFCDEIFVCSEWAKKIILNNTSFSKEKVHVAPLGIDPEVFTESPQSTRKETVFFNCGKWEIRKGHDIILECFEKAFSLKDNVELWMMCHNPFHFAKGEEWESKYQRSKMTDKIRLIPRMPDQKSVYHIMKQVDCGVFPARAEGWNLELLELMSIGKQVITTNYSGHTEFCNKNNSMLIDVNELEPAIDGVWFNGQGNWAKITNAHKDLIIDYMRKIHQDKLSGSLKQNIEGINTGKTFTWSNTANKIVEKIYAI